MLRLADTSSELRRPSAIIHRSHSVMSSSPSIILFLLPALVFLSLLLPSGVTAVEDCVVSHMPLSLISFDLNHPRTSTSNIKMDGVESTLATLSQIKTPVAVVAIAGRYRSGKSWFLNQLLPPSPHKFTVGHTTEAQTQDVQMHIIPGCALRSQGLNNDELTVLFLDTPGLYSADRFRVFDAQLLALLNLISSVVLYNSESVIDRPAIEQLSTAMETAFLLSFFSSQNPTDPNSTPERSALDRPHLIWLIQNFHLQMTEATGREYLLRKLNQSDNGRNEEAKSYSDRFNRFFASIDLLTFPAPTTLTADVANLTELPWEALTSDYRRAVENVRKEVVSKAYAKKVAGSAMTGELLVDLLRTWIEIMAVKVADLREQSTEVLFDGIIRKELDKARAYYMEQMGQLTLPASRASLKQRSEQVVASILNGKESIPRFAPQVQDMVTQVYGDLNSQNEKQLDEVSGKQLRDITQSILDKATEKMKALETPYEPARITEIEAAMTEEWKAAIAGTSEAAQSMAAEYGEKWFAKWWRGRHTCMSTITRSHQQHSTSSAH